MHGKELHGSGAVAVGSRLSAHLISFTLLFRGSFRAGMPSAFLKKTSSQWKETARQLLHDVVDRMVDNTDAFGQLQPSFREVGSDRRRLVDDDSFFRFRFDVADRIQSDMLVTIDDHVQNLLQSRGVSLFIVRAAGERGKKQQR